MQRHDEQVAIFHKGVGRVRRIRLRLVVAPASRTQFVGPVAQVNVRAVEFIRPHQGHAFWRIAWRVRRVVPAVRQGDVQLCVVVEDGARGDLQVALQVPIDRIAQFYGEMLVRLETLVDDDGHFNLLDELPWRKHQGAGLAEVILSRFGRPLHSLEIDRHFFLVRGVQTDFESEGAVEGILQQRAVGHELNLRVDRLRGASAIGASHCQKGESKSTQPRVQPLGSVHSAAKIKVK